MLTVKQIAEAAGVSCRTIRHYDNRGLLSPARIGANGYRYYGESEVLRLQQILFYRELGFSLEEISGILEAEEFNLIEALRGHRKELESGIRRLERLIETVDDTILHLSEGIEMRAEDVFKGFTAEEQENYAREAENMYDPQVVKESNARWKGRSKNEQEAILKESQGIYNDFLAVMSEEPDSKAVLEVVGRWRKSIEHFWVPEVGQLVPLAESYASDTRFKKNFDKLHPDLAEFIGRAVHAYVAAL